MTIKKILKPPYYAVIFSSIRTDSQEGYEKMSQHIEALVQKQPGFIGFDSAFQEGTKSGISVSYWHDIESIRNWKNNVEHQQAQQLGKHRWYKEYSVKIARVECEYSNLSRTLLY